MGVNSFFMAVTAIAPRRLVRLASALLIVASLFGGLAFAQSALADPPVSKSSLGGVAIGGHDTTAYSRLTRDPRASAVDGEKRYEVDYLGATWRFASAESRDAFQADPERYLPGYNGFCANALSLGEGLVRTDGSHWEIFGDELFLFYADRGRQRWLDGDWQVYRREADSAWRALAGE